MRWRGYPESNPLVASRFARKRPAGKWAARGKSVGCLCRNFYCCWIGSARNHARLHQRSRPASRLRLPRAEAASGTRSGAQPEPRQRRLSAAAPDFNIYLLAAFTTAALAEAFAHLAAAVVAAEVRAIAAQES